MVIIQGLGSYFECFIYILLPRWLIQLEQKAKVQTNPLKRGNIIPIPAYISGQMSNGDKVWEVCKVAHGLTSLKYNWPPKSAMCMSKWAKIDPFTLVLFTI